MPSSITSAPACGSALMIASEVVVIGIARHGERHQRGAAFALQRGEAFVDAGGHKWARKVDSSSISPHIGNQIVACPLPALDRQKACKGKYRGPTKGHVVAIQKSNDPAKFIAFEQAGWANSIAGYDDTFGVVTRQTVDATLDAAKVRAGMKVLDMCCGPGMLAGRLCTRRTSDRAGFFGVVALARRLVPDRRIPARRRARSCRSPTNHSMPRCAATA